MYILIHMYSVSSLMVIVYHTNSTFRGSSKWPKVTIAIRQL